MGEIRRDSFIDPILENLGNSYFLVRRTATEALVKFGEPIRKEVNCVFRRNPAIDSDRIRPPVPIESGH